MNPRNLNICMLPMEIRWEQKEENLSNLNRLFESLHPDTDLVVLPETFSTGFPVGVEKEQIRPMAERNTGATVEFLKSLAARHRVAIAGSFIADSGGSLYN
ncbi:MAG: nitrilase family protein, partial [Muribaculaceae bacterium]|nr:nitrilase family protein [Muribaculaceae bacterium]